MRTYFFAIFPWLFLQIGCSPDEVHSFDVFDTLVGRLHTNSRSIFEQMEQQSGIVGFAEARISAEAAVPHSRLDAIYAQLAKDLNLTRARSEELHQLELATDIKNVFPININLQKVEDGDVLISDTYYTEEELRAILIKVGLRKNVKIFATPKGKAARTIWSEILKKYDIVEHLGDNQDSDVDSPKSFGISGVLFKEAGYSEYEQRVKGAGEIGLANLMRTLRLLNAYHKDSHNYRSWDEQAQINLPILITASQYLNEFAQKNHKRRLLFSARGSVHAFSIFKTLFPNYESIYFHTSRPVYMNPSPEYVEYVKELYNTETFVVDESGTGKSFFSFFQKNLPSVTPIQVAICRNSSAPYGVIYGRCTHLERYNYALEGTLIGYDKNGPIRQAPGYNLDLVRPAHECISRSLELLKEYKFGPFQQTLADELATAESNFHSVYGDLPEFVREHI